MCKSVIIILCILLVSVLFYYLTNKKLYGGSEFINYMFPKPNYKNTPPPVGSYGRRNQDHSEALELFERQSNDKFNELNRNQNKEFDNIVNLEAKQYPNFEEGMVFAEDERQESDEWLYKEAQAQNIPVSSLPQRG